MRDLHALGHQHRVPRASRAAAQVEVLGVQRVLGIEAAEPLEGQPAA
jgi:hypothetical protein